MCGCLNSSGFVALPLSGPHLDSLRRLRLNRDGKRRQILALDGPDGKQSRKDSEEDNLQDELPALSKLTVKRPCNFLVRSIRRQLLSFFGSV